MAINRLGLIAGILLVLSVIILIVAKRSPEAPPLTVVVPEEVEEVTKESDPKNLTYDIAGEAVTLVDGKSTVPAAPGSAQVVTTQYFGNELTVDIDADGVDDTVFLLTQDGGGSGTFFYLAAARKTVDGYVGTEAVFIGDRIAPQNITRGTATGTVVVNYADRAPGESFAVPPSIGKSLVLTFNATNNEWGELVVDFEGESAVPAVSGGSAPAPEPTLVVDPAPTAALTAKTWHWVEARYEDGRVVTPERAGAFTLTFNADGSFGITTDCNGGGGSYTSKNGTLTLGDMMSTLMFCEGSQEGEYQQLLGAVSDYHFTAAGELILDLKFDSGTMLFK